MVDLARAHALDRARSVPGSSRSPRTSAIRPRRCSEQPSERPARVAHEAGDLVALLEQQLRQERAVLAGDAGDQGASGLRRTDAAWHGGSLCRRQRRHTRRPAPARRPPGRTRSRDALPPAPSGRPVAARTRDRLGQRGARRPAAPRPLLLEQLGQRPDAAGRRPAGRAAIASAAASPNVSAEREGTSAIAAPARSAASSASLDAPDEAHVAHRRPAPAERRARGLAGHHQRHARRAGRRRSRRPRPSRAADRASESDPERRREPRRLRLRELGPAHGVGSGTRQGGASTCTRSHGSGAPSSRSRSRANPLGTITASACASRRRCHSASEAP